MKKIGFLLFICISFFMPVLADYGLTLDQFLNSYFNVIIQDNSIPSTYQYIKLKYTNVPVKTKLYKTLQKAVYLDLFPNASLNLPLDKQITQEQAMSIINKGFNLTIPVDKKALVTVDRLRNALLEIQDLQMKEALYDLSVPQEANDIATHPMFQDVYTRLHSTYVSSGALNEKDLLYGSIKGLVEGLKDPYTSFFPPTEASNLNDELQGEYYGIGAYVEMNTPGELVIVSPIKGSPAEKIGLLGGDRIVQINDKVVDSDMSLTSATTLIKGPAGTPVELKILREGKLLPFSVIRAKVVINNVESEVYPSKDGNICEISIIMFDFGVAKDFQEVMSSFATKKCTKYIFDVRNNPGGGLDEVVRMLNYFVPTGKPSVIIKSKFTTDEILAWNPATSKINNTPIRVLINKGSASASEIFAGVIKDYATGAILVGENSFGKGSVQELLNYDDGSMLKYTVAKRYMGKSDTNIDHVGIKPDVLVIDKKETNEDEVLQWAIKN